MADIFIRKDTGEEYELVGEYANPGIVIKPLPKVEEKKVYRLGFETFEERFLIEEDYELTESQATAVADALREVMRYIVGTTGSDRECDWEGAVIAAHGVVALQQEVERGLGNA